MRYSFLIIPVVFLFTSCSSEEQAEQKPVKETNNSVARPDKGLVPAINSQTQVSVEDTFQSDPVQVVEAVFEAARTKDYSVLSTLCDPMGENDDPTSNICNVDNDSKERENEFIDFFSKGKVAGEAVIQGNTASIPIKFGPTGKKDEVFVLVLRNGLWYLGQI